MFVEVLALCSPKRITIFITFLVCLEIHKVLAVTPTQSCGQSAETLESTRKQRCGRQTRDVNSKPPEIQPFSFSKNSALGQRASVGCLVVGGTAPFRFHWEQNGRAIVNSASKYAKTKSEDLATVVIEKVGAQDVGNYTCFVTNAFGTDSYTALLVVEAPALPRPSLYGGAVRQLGRADLLPPPYAVYAYVSEVMATITVIAFLQAVGYLAVQGSSYDSPQIQPFSFPRNLRLGLKTSVACMAYSGTGPFEFLWKHDGKVVDDSAATKYVKIIAENIATLTIERVQTVDIGNYTCIVNSAAGKDSYTAELTTEGTVDTPVIMPYSFPKNVALGQKTIVTCVAQSGASPLDFQWWHNGRAIVDTSSRYSKKLAERVSTMSIEKLSAEDLGNYTCVVSNSAGQDTFTAPLLVEDLPRIQPFSFPENVNLGDEASVTCVVTRGSKPLRVTWTQDGKVVPNSDRKFAKVLLDNINTLTIRSVKAEDVGELQLHCKQRLRKSHRVCNLSRSKSDRWRSVSVYAGNSAHIWPEPPPSTLIVRNPDRWTSVSTGFTFVLDYGIIRNFKKSRKAAPAEVMIRSLRFILLVTFVRAYGPPEISPFSFSRNVLPGQKAVANCAVVGGDGPFTFHWTQDGRKLQTSATKYVKAITDTIVALTIEEVGLEDVGNYTCTVSNAAAEDSYTGALVVKGRPEIMPFSFSKNIALGQKATVTCVVSHGTGPFRIEWKHGEPRVVSDSRKHVQTVNENVVVLTIDSVTAEDIGNYTCNVVNEAGTAAYSSLLAVEEPPVIMPFAFARDSRLGQKTFVTCAVARGTQPLKISWTHGGKPLVNTDHKYATALTSNIVTMTIEQLSAEDIGNYTCTATNEAGIDSVTAALLVEGPPEVQPFFFSKNVALGGRAVVHCAVVGGRGPFVFRWSMNGNDLQSSNSKYSEAVSEEVVALTIEKITAEDVGNYTCTVSNSAGSDSFTAALAVKGPPAIMPFSFLKNLVLGQKTIATCVVSSGTGPFDFVWTHGDRTVSSNPRKQVKVLARKCGSAVD
ncbi:hypothetical protein HPB48_008461 [Haemaphysalis longicornis]|uniref:Ig-like domain-containing protein n=1 Tax=Haemaphysalis longicornis TaxID=44386 RepID=A0A9J6FML9_HAELO|nr:hypothetical protein HPB48_008461 [Haemaphysalis longicornis]